MGVGQGAGVRRLGLLRQRRAARGGGELIERAARLRLRAQPVGFGLRARAGGLVVRQRRFLAGVHPPHGVGFQRALGVQTLLGGGGVQLSQPRLPPGFAQRARQLPARQRASVLLGVLFALGQAAGQLALPPQPQGRAELDFPFTQAGVAVQAVAALREGQRRRAGQPGVAGLPLAIPQLLTRLAHRLARRPGAVKRLGQAGGLCGRGQAQPCGQGQAAKRRRLHGNSTQKWLGVQYWRRRPSAS